MIKKNVESKELVNAVKESSYRFRGEIAAYTLALMSPDVATGCSRQGETRKEQSGARKYESEKWIRGISVKDGWREESKSAPR